MSQTLQLLNGLPGHPLLMAADGPVPDFTPTLPKNLQGITGQILGWAAGIGVSMAVLGQLLGWTMVAIGYTSERPNLASRGKQSVVWSLVGGMGLACSSGLVMLFYNAAKGGN